MTAEQKNDAVNVVGKIKIANSLDYVVPWYFKAADFIKNTLIKCCFVSTNSITQGEQVAPVWGALKNKGVNILFAYKTFIWDSQSSDIAHVHCVIIGFSYGTTDDEKFIVESDGNKIKTRHINGYLVDADDVFIEKRSYQICNALPMDYGSMPNDGGNFIFSEQEYKDAISKEPYIKKFIKKFVGATEFINNKIRYCLWLKNASPEELRKSKIIIERIENIRQLRLRSTAKPTRDKAATPHLFFYCSHPNGHYLLVPSTSSEKRNYIPIGFMDKDTVSSNLNLIVPNAELFHFGILTSSIHMAWMRAVAGRLEMRYRYSTSIVYNNFIWPNLSDTDKNKIEQTAQKILDIRNKYKDSSLADLYDVRFMPVDLLKAHQANDRAVMKAYGFKSSMTESEIVAELFKLYQKKVDELAEAEAAQKAAKKPRKRKTTATASTEPA